MISRQIKPQDDDLDAFIPMLTTLRERAAWKPSVPRNSARAEGRVTRLLLSQADALQGAFKILINSFYGFLGTNGLHLQRRDGRGHGHRSRAGPCSSASSRNCERRIAA